MTDGASSGGERGDMSSYTKVDRGKRCVVGRLRYM